jgi:hypothetical protein
LASPPPKPSPIKGEGSCSEAAHMQYLPQSVPIEGEWESEELDLPRLRESQQFLGSRLAIQVDHPAIFDDGR